MEPRGSRAVITFPLPLLSAAGKQQEGAAAGLFDGCGFKAVWHRKGDALVHLGLDADGKRRSWTKDELRAWVRERAGIDAERVLVDTRFESAENRRTFRTIARRIRRKGDHAVFY